MPGKAATQQNAVLHGRLFALARQSSNAARSNAPTQSCMGSFLRLSVTAAKQQRSLARAPFYACQAKQQRSRTQSCTGSLFCLPGEAATHLASAAVIKHDWIVKQQNAVLHGLLVLLARGGSNTLGKHDGHPARRSSSTTVIQHDGTVRRKSWPSRGYPVLGHRPLGFQPVCQCVCLGISVWVSSNVSSHVITTMLSLGGLSVCLSLLANVITACRLGGIRCLQLCVSQAKQVWGNMAVPSNIDGLVTNTSNAGVCEARSRSRVSVFGYRLMYRAM